jgi:phage shock protein A
VRLAALAAALRGEESRASDRADDLRADERSVAERLGAAVDERRAGLATEVIETFDRMTDSIDTLTHVVAQAEHGLRRKT